jgi:hypothetical protein
MDSRILVWNTDSGILKTSLAHPDTINKPGALKSILFNEYLIVLFADNKIIVFKYRDESIESLIDDII